MKTMHKVILFLYLLLPLIASGAEPYKAFVDKDYDRERYQVTRRDIEHGKLHLRVIEVQSLGSRPICRAWLDVFKSEVSIYRKYFDDMNPLGFSFGLFVPDAQTPAPFFAVVKNGDYDGRLYLIRDDGKVFDLDGGFYFITSDKRYLFSEHAIDGQGLLVFDLKEEKPVFRSDRIPPMQQWYLKGDKYFFTESEWLPENQGNPTEKAGIGHFYDFASHKFVEKSITDTYLKSAKKIKFDFDPREYEDCLADSKTSLKRGMQKTPAP